MHEALVHFLIRHRKTILASMAIITLFFLFQAVHTQMFTQFLDLFPKDHPYVQVHKKYAKYFGGAYHGTGFLVGNQGAIMNNSASVNTWIPIGMTPPLD